MIEFYFKTFYHNERFALRSSRKMKGFSSASTDTSCVDLASLKTPFGYFSLVQTICIEYKNISISSSVRSVREILWAELTTLNNLLILCGNKIILSLNNMIMILKYKWTIICGEFVKITFKVVGGPYRYFLTLPENNNLNLCLFVFQILENFSEVQSWEMFSLYWLTLWNIYDNNELIKRYFRNSKFFSKKL